MLPRRPIVLRIPGVPVGQPRHRSRIAWRKIVRRVGRHTITDREPYVQTYPVRFIGEGPKKRPHPIVAYKAAVESAARSLWTGEPTEEPVGLSALFMLPRTVKLTWKRKPMVRMHHTAPPDRDNCEKAVMDALNGVVWRDDAQVCRGSIEKLIVAGHEAPKTIVVIGRPGPPAASTEAPFGIPNAPCWGQLDLIE